jgi:hypothetical protein
VSSQRFVMTIEDCHVHYEGLRDVKVSNERFRFQNKVGTYQATDAYASLWMQPQPPLIGLPSSLMQVVVNLMVPLYPLGANSIDLLTS